MKSSLGSKTYDGISSQPDVWRNILNGSKKQLDKAKPFSNISRPERIILTGCGITYAPSVGAAKIIRRQGITAAAYPASELAFYPELMIVQAELLVAISRSGMTSETLWAVKAFRKQSPDGKVCAITTRTDSILAGLADIVLDASPAQEQSIGETRSFTAMLLLAQHFAAHKQEDQAFSVGVQTGLETLKAGMPAFFGLARQIAYILPINHFFFLGVGWLYVIAYEAAFKIKEFHLVGHPDSQGNQTGQFISLADLRRKVLAFIECCNRTMAKPFKWTYLGKALAVQIVNRLCFDVLVSAFVCGLLLYTNESVH